MFLNKKFGKKTSSLFIVALVLFSMFSCLFTISFDNNIVAGGSWDVNTSGLWTTYTDTNSNCKINAAGLSLDGSDDGTWISSWYNVGNSVTNATLTVDTNITLFDNIKRTILMDGSATPIGSYDWYGRPTLYIDSVNYSRWYLPFRTGTDHSAGSDGVNILTSNDEGKTWNSVDTFYDGSSITGDVPFTPRNPYEGEPLVILCPNGSLVMQTWDGLNSGDFKQWRSYNKGKSWSYESTDALNGEPGGYYKGSQQYIQNPYDSNSVLCVFETMGASKTCIITNSTDNCESFTYMSTFGGGTVFEPSLEFVGNHKLVSIIRPGTDNGHTYLVNSTDMGATWNSRYDIVSEVGYWERARIYLESNPLFDSNSYMNYTLGEGRLWGVGTQDWGNGNTNRSICVYYSDNAGEPGSWEGPFNLYSNPPSHDSPPPSHSYRDAGYADIKRRSDGSFSVVSYYATGLSSSGPSDLVQIDFGGERARVLVEVDTNNDGVVDQNSRWSEIYNGTNTVNLNNLSDGRWRIKFDLDSNDTISSPFIQSFNLSFDSSSAFEFGDINRGGNSSSVVTSSRYGNCSVPSSDDISGISFDSQILSTVSYQVRVANDSSFSDVFINESGLNQWFNLSSVVNFYGGHYYQFRTRVKVVSN